MGELKEFWRQALLLDRNGDSLGIAYAMAFLVGSGFSVVWVLIALSGFLNLHSDLVTLGALLSLFTIALAVPAVGFKGKLVVLVSGMVGMVMSSSAMVAVLLWLGSR